jgi:hypothetical protein
LPVGFGLRDPDLIAILDVRRDGEPARVTNSSGHDLAKRRATV